MFCRLALLIATAQLEVPAKSEPHRIEIHDIAQVTDTFITFRYLEISRLGDYAKGYLNAKWVAAKLGVPVVLRPFPHSSKFKISENL